MKAIRLFLLVIAAVLVAFSGEAAKKGKGKASAKAKPVAKAVAAAPVQTAHRRSPYVGAISADAKSGKVFFADNADTEAYPASVTKLMTLLLVLEDVQAGKYSLGDKVEATPDVNRCEPSWVGLKAGDRMTVRDLCYSLMVESANDAAIALGVHSAGSFGGFISRMNGRASELGMTKTAYYNPNGLPPKQKYPWKKFNTTTARDQLKLARALLKTSSVLDFTSVKTCDLVKTADGYRVEITRRVNSPQCKTELGEGETFVKTFCNHNNVMVKDKLKIFNPDGREAVDGLKTGYIDAGGSSVVITASRNGHRVIAVVLGSSTAKERDAAASRLLTDALGAVAW